MKMIIKKVRILSELDRYAMGAERGEKAPAGEVEQRLTITSSGSVWFTAYDTDGDETHVGRRINLSVGEAIASVMLRLVGEYYNGGAPNDDVSGVGMWHIEITDADGFIYEKYGSLCGGVRVDDIDLTDYIRKRIPIQSLAVFDMP